MKIQRPKTTATVVGVVLISVAGLGLVAPRCFADDRTERAYLLQLLNQLTAMQPLIRAAAQVQPRNERIQFHYTAYRDANGQLHNGLWEDVQAIKQGIQAKLDSVAVEPRVPAPLSGDYSGNLLPKGGG